MALREGNHGGNAGEPAGDRSGAATATDIFSSRIRPIMHVDKPPSCVECHLSGMGLANYIRPSQAKTFALLRSAELINEQAPDASKLLPLISRHSNRLSLMNDAERAAALRAFRVWIHAAVEPQLSSPRKTPKRLARSFP